METFLLPLDGDSDSGSEQITTVVLEKIIHLIEDFKNSIEPEASLIAEEKTENVNHFKVMVNPGRLGLKGRADGSIKEVASDVQKTLLEIEINFNSKILKIDGAVFNSELLAKKVKGTTPYELEIQIREEDEADSVDEEEEDYFYDEEHYESYFYEEEESLKYDYLAEKYEANFYNEISFQKLKNKRSKKIRTIKAKYLKNPTDDARKNKRKARTEFHRQYISPVADTSYFISAECESSLVNSVAGQLCTLLDDLITGFLNMNFQPDEKKVAEKIARLFISVGKYEERKRLVSIFTKQFDRLNKHFEKKIPTVAREIEYMQREMEYKLEATLRKKSTSYNYDYWSFRSISDELRCPLRNIQKLIKKASSCAICCDDDKDLTLVRTECYTGCHLCVDCVKGFLKSSAERGKTKLKCPGMGCDCKIKEPERIFGKCAPAAFKTFKESIWKNKLRACKDFRFCPKEDCGCGFQLPSRCCHVKSVACPECDYTFCPHCYGPDHSEIGTCLEFLALCQGKDSSQVTSNNTKQCPFCLVWIEKNDGCSHMTCDNCFGEFCWLCMGDWKLHGYNDCPKLTKFTVERPTFQQLLPTRPLGFYKLNRDACIRLQARMKSWRVNFLPKDTIVNVVAFRGNRVQIEYNNWTHWCSVKTASGPLLEHCKEQVKAEKQLEKQNETQDFYERYRDPNHPPPEMRLFDEESFRDVARILVVDFNAYDFDGGENFQMHMGIKWCFTPEQKLVEPEFEDILENFEAKQLKKKERENLTFRHNYNRFGMKNKLTTSKNKKNSSSDQKEQKRRRRKVNHFRTNRSQQQQSNSEASMNAQKFEQKRRARKQSCRPETDFSLLEETNELMFVYV